MSFFGLPTVRRVDLLGIAQCRVDLFRLKANVDPNGLQNVCPAADGVVRDRRTPYRRIRRALGPALAALFAVGTANAQFAHSTNSPSSAIVLSPESSSNDYQLLIDNPTGDDAEPSPEAGRAATGQYDNNSGGGSQNGLRSKLAIEAGGGVNAPTSDSSAYITWGGNFTVGAGLNFTKRMTMLAEYQFIDDKLPGVIIAETGASGGNAHIWSLTLEPVIYLFPEKTNRIYLTGGGGFYRKVTNFSSPQPTQYCTYYYCGTGYQNMTIGHFSSNQGGWNVGVGYARRIGGMYGDSKMQLFAEARYLDVNTPEVNSSPNGLGTTFIGAGTKIIPVTFGLRF